MEDVLHSKVGYTQNINNRINCVNIFQKASNVCATMATEQLADLENSSIGILVSRDPLNKVSGTRKFNRSKR